MHTETTALDYSSTDISFKNIYTRALKERNSKKNIKFFEIIDFFFSMWAPISEKFLNYLLKPMKRLQINEYEMVYMLAYTLWNTQG